MNRNMKEIKREAVLKDWQFLFLNRRGKRWTKAHEVHTSQEELPKSTKEECR